MNDLPTMPTKRKEILASWDISDDETEAHIYWEDFVYDVKEIMKKMQTTRFFAYGLSLTWRNVAGYTEFDAVDAKTLIYKLAPSTSDYTMVFHPTENKGIIEVVISHHDKPMGETIYLMSQTMEKKEKIKEKYSF